MSLVLCRSDTHREMTHHYIQSKMYEMIGFLPGVSIQISCLGETEGFSVFSQVWGEFQNGCFCWVQRSTSCCTLISAGDLKKSYLFWSTLTLPDSKISRWRQGSVSLNRWRFRRVDYLQDRTCYLDFNLVDLSFCSVLLLDFLMEYVRSWKPVILDYSE